ncbi:beta-class phenol-soluble modulin [Corynebacterium glyciniphilum]|uniref:beta-class phenol-soluble modulin n=1 Tax=Corynebacterium glyciniphilum TaxID=1404244 RepID=UPI003FD5B7A6
MFDALTEPAKSISGIVTSAIEGDWAGLATNIVGTVRDSIGVGSSALEAGSSVIEASAE